jgi:outer membrane protein, heavy metal efflux system
LPRLEEALEQATYAYERGRYSYLEWTVAQRELLEGRLRLLESAARFHVLRIEIERLTGASLQSIGEVK